jgi:DUF4097 and DUF4098 domain-containing protein YvlB
MRRTSFVAPLLLIVIGGLFLARNIYPEMPLLDWVSKYWPLILIGWGLLRIVEIVSWAARSKPLPARGLSGGEWVLIVFLCLFGASLHAVRGFSNWWPDHVGQLNGLGFLGGERYEYPVSAEKSCSRTPRIVLEDFRGDAKINGVEAAVVAGGSADQVKVTGHKTIRSMDQTQADKANEGASLDISGDANNVVIRIREDQAQRFERVTATLEINVPKGASVEVHGRTGDLDINDIAGSVAITSDNAGVRLKNIGGAARVELSRSDVVHMSGVKGEVEIKGHGSDIELEDIAGSVNVDGTYNGTIELRKLAKPLRFNGPRTNLSMEAVPGEVSMSLGGFNGSKFTGPTHLTRRSSDVEISDFSGPLDISIERGDLNLSPGLPLGSIQAHLRSGDIRLSLPAAAQFSLSASTNNGNISNPFGGGFKIEANGRRGTLRGAVGAGPAIQLETQRGDITVQKAVAAGANAPLEKLDQ